MALIELFKAKNALHFYCQCHGLPYWKLVERKGYLKYVECVISSLAPPWDKKWRRDANGQVIDGIKKEIRELEIILSFEDPELLISENKLIKQMKMLNKRAAFPPCVSQTGA